MWKITLESGSGWIDWLILIIFQGFDVLWWCDECVVLFGLMIDDWWFELTVCDGIEFRRKVMDWLMDWWIDWLMRIKIKGMDNRKEIEWWIERERVRQRDENQSEWVRLKSKIGLSICVCVCVCMCRFEEFSPRVYQSVSVSFSFSFSLSLSLCLKGEAGGVVLALNQKNLPKKKWRKSPKTGAMFNFQDIFVENQHHFTGLS